MAGSSLWIPKDRFKIYKNELKPIQRVRFIFLHKPLLELQGWKEDARERACATNSQRQDDERVAVGEQGPPTRGQAGQGDGTAELRELPSTPGSKRRG